MPKVCAEIGLYQAGIITKSCLINENMTQVSELIHQQGQAGVPDQCGAVELGGRGGLAAESSILPACVISMKLYFAII